MTTTQLIPELSVTQFDKSLAFYVDVLGFKISYQRKEDGFAFLALDNAQLMIEEIDRGRTWRTGELDFPLGRGVNFQIPVKNIDSILIRLKQQGINLFLEPEEKWYRRDTDEIGHKQFLVMDPDGYLLRFVEEIGSRSLEVGPSRSI